MHRGELGEEAALAAVGAAVEHEPAAAGEHRPVRPRAALELDHHPLATVIRSDEFLLAREDQLDRTAGGARERRDVSLEVKVALGAEPAAEERHDHAHVGLRDLEDMRDSAPRGERHLRRRPDGHAVALPLGENRPRLDGSALGGVDEVPALDDDVRRRERGRGVALDDRGVAEHVAVAAHLVVALVRGPLLVDQRRVVGRGRLDLGDRG
jgi:hypothetical protein